MEEGLGVEKVETGLNRSSSTLRVSTAKNTRVVLRGTP